MKRFFTFCIVLLFLPIVSFASESMPEFTIGEFAYSAPSDWQFAADGAMQTHIGSTAVVRMRLVEVTQTPVSSESEANDLIALGLNAIAADAEIEYFTVNNLFAGAISFPAEVNGATFQYCYVATVYNTHALLYQFYFLDASTDAVPELFYQILSTIHVPT